MTWADNQQKLQTALFLHQKGNLNEAAKLYRELINTNPNNFPALHFLGVIEASIGNVEHAKILMARSMSIQPPNIKFIENYATILFQMGDAKSAIQICQQGLQLNDRNIELLYLSAVAFFKLNKLQESIAQFDNLLSLQSGHVAALNERGSVLAEMEQYDAALASIEKALVLNRDYPEAYLNRGNVNIRLKRYDEAILAFDKALALKPNLSNAWLGRGSVFRELKRYDEAFAAYDKALSLNPDLANAWLGRGNVFCELKRHDEAFSAYDKALSLNPDLANAWLGRGNVSLDINRHDDAFAAYDKALTLMPKLPNVESLRLYSKMHLCDWSNFDAECAHLLASVRNGTVVAQPFPILSILSSSKDEIKCAKLWIANKFPVSGKPIWQGEQYNHDRIRVAYLSADFCQHPVSLLTVGMFECHDKNRFDVTAISIGPDDNSEIRQRLKSSFEHFIEAKAYSDEQLARLIRELEIDILIDLMGFTKGARTDVLARRPAPIQINYLGYAGTMGADFVDYLIADPTLIPSSQQRNYAEKIVNLPNSYMPHDEAGRVISDRNFERAEFGLPQEGFVFCCFNNSFKFNPEIFDCWTRILKAVEGSVLWLSTPNPTAVANLRREINARGLSPDRLVFANRLPLMEEHLARVRLADLFLDTLPYNAHTTASDALWVGLPVLTCIGETFAGRVAASLLNAIGIPELITTTLEAYEQMAVDLATHPEKLVAIKNKLVENRMTTPLFDTKLFTKHIEAAYTAMYECHQAGLPPDHIVIPN